MRILGIETSCDETGLAVYDGKQGLMGDVLYSQVLAHRRYGGVVPELASRDHVRKVVPLLDSLLEKANCSLNSLDGIAYTKGPGLMGALLVGACFAKALAFSLGIPALGVHHLEAHLQAPMLEEKKPDYPFVGLLISGGHSQLLHARSFNDYALLGETVDDAVGEAFDKTAKLLGLPYPGGPELERLAQMGEMGRYTFTKPMVNRPGCDFSFSGLKTQVLNAWQKSGRTEQDKADIACGFQQTVCQTLVIKCRRALKETNAKHLLVSGGVSANKEIRGALTDLAADMGGEVFFPRQQFCTDNGAMVAYLGYLHMSAGRQDDDNGIHVQPRLPL